MCGAARWWSGTTTNCNPGPLSVAGDKVWIAGTLGDVAVVLVHHVLRSFSPSVTQLTY